jgi:predicted restriction endonuclease
METGLILRLFRKISGGETSMANTLPLCGRHHRLLHEGVFSIHANHNDEWYFRNAAGKILQ